MAQAPAIREEVLATCTSSGDKELDEKVYTATTDEASRGWLQGPLTEEQLSALGPWILSRRFGII